MSRRKQARPRVLKPDPQDLADDVDLVMGGEDEDGTSDMLNVQDLETAESSNAIAGQNGFMEEEDESCRQHIVSGMVTEDVPGEYRCEACGAIFTNLIDFMDHRSFDCLQECLDDTSSWKSGENDLSPTPSSSSCSADINQSPSQFLNYLDSPVLEALDQLPHSVGVTENNPYGCQFCEKAFPRLSFLKKHEQVHADLLPFKCGYCKRLFRHKRSRDRHVKLHTGDKQYKCHECSAAFARSDHLKSHLRTHDNGKAFHCQICNRGYTTATALTVHMVSHTKADSCSTTGNEFCCLQCKESFMSAADLQEHIKIHQLDNENEPMLQCSCCTEVFIGQSALTGHMASAHGNDKGNKCPVCLDCFMSPEELYQHMTVHNNLTLDEDPPILNVAGMELTVLEGMEESDVAKIMCPTGTFICPYCIRDQFNSLEALEIHMQGVHSVKSTEIYTCNYCNAPYHNLYSLHEHMKVVHRNRPCLDIKYPCNRCSGQFSSLENLLEHKGLVHVNSPEQDQSGADCVYCFQCFMSFPNSSLLTMHMSEAHGFDDKQNQNEKESKNMPATDSGNNENTIRLPDSKSEMLMCKHCGAKFRDSMLLQKHVSVHLEVMSLEPHVCRMCNKSFPMEDQLEAHSTSHYLSTMVEYGCTSCIKTFAKPDELQKHLMDIHAHHLYRCSLCKELFDSKVNIQVHFAVKHSNECKIYKCTQCTSVFRSEMEWQVHVRVSHLNISKPYRCLFCKESFSTEMGLQCHLTTHNKPFKCPVCEEAFHVEYLLDKHLEIAHDPAANSHGNSPSKIKQEPIDSGDMTSPGKMKGDVVASDCSPAQFCSSRVWKSSDLLHVCNICDMQFTQASQLQMHKLQEHGVMNAKSSSLSPLSFYPSDQMQKNVFTGSPSEKQMLACSYCSQCFKCRSDLDKHLKIHMNSSNLKCNICDEVFSCSSILAEHKLTHCKVQQGNVCTICKTILKSEDQFYVHSQEHGFQGAVMQCNICRQSLASVLELQMHGKHHFQTKSSFFTCCVCLKMYASKENLVAKLNSSGRTYYVCKPCYHGRSPNVSCTQCSQTFSSDELLQTHMQTHKKTYQCIKCQESFSSEYDIQLHVASHVMQEGNIHECKLCSQSFESPAKLQCHLIEHTYKAIEMCCSICCKLFAHASEMQAHALEHGMSCRKYACKQCSQKFFFSAELDNHMHDHGVLDANLKCTECHKIFTSSLNLNNHKKSHEQKLGTLKCSLCPETFISMGDLQQHFFSGHKDAESETARKTFRCTECELEFPCMSNLQGHMRIHKSGAKYPCPVCKKVFALSRNLNIHIRSHSGEKPYECPICQRRFARKENRKSHLKSHSGLRPYLCPICGKSFSRKCHVKDHMRTHFAQDSSIMEKLGDLDANSDNTSGTSDEPRLTPQLHIDSSSDEEMELNELPNALNGTTELLTVGHEPMS